MADQQSTDQQHEPAADVEAHNARVHAPADVEAHNARVHAPADVEAHGEGGTDVSDDDVEAQSLRNR